MTDSQILTLVSPFIVIMGVMRGVAGDPWWLLGAKVCAGVAGMCVVAVWFRRV